MNYKKHLTFKGHLTRNVSCAHAILCPPSMMNLYAEATVNFSCFSHLYMETSSSVSAGEWSLSRLLSSLISVHAMSHVWASNLRFHLVRCHSALVIYSLSSEQVKVFGNNLTSDKSEHQWSCQNETLLFLPTLKEMLDSTMFLVSFNPFQKEEVLEVLRGLLCQPPFVGPYLSRMTFCRCPLGFDSKPHQHLERRAKLDIFKSLTLSPPSLFSL